MFTLFFIPAWWCDKRLETSLNELCKGLLYDIFDLKYHRDQVDASTISHLLTLQIFDCR